MPTTGLEAALIAVMSILATALVGGLVTLVRSKQDKSAHEASERHFNERLTSMEIVSKERLDTLDKNHKELIEALRQDLKEHRESDERLAQEMRNCMHTLQAEIKSDLRALRESR